MKFRRSLAFAASAAAAAVGLAPAASAAPAAPAPPSVSTVQLSAHRAMPASSSTVRAMQTALGVSADGVWGPKTDRAAWAFEAQVYMQWPAQAGKVQAMQRAFNLDPVISIPADGAWGAKTEYAFRYLRTKYYR